MDSKVAIIITSINAPTKAVVDIASSPHRNGSHFIVIGDEKSPSDFHTEGCEFLGIGDQRALDSSFAKACPTRHYARKNIGYIEAIRKGVEVIVETDDDNIPLDNFWDKRSDYVNGDTIDANGWVNAYSYFSSALIWPRGLDLNSVKSAAPVPTPKSGTGSYCPVQQALADGDPDVDAIYRLILPLPIYFDKRDPIVLGAGAWCPFNSQNTTWYKPAFPLLYLPYCCSFRMTDIWRSFVAQRILWANDWNLSFHEASVFQDRNEHNILRDFSEEVVGYLNNQTIADALTALELKPGVDNIPENMRMCYRALVDMKLVGAEELALLDMWLEDIA